MQGYARVCQRMSEYARVRVCQRMPEYSRVCQSMPEYARVCQSMPESFTPASLAYWLTALILPRDPGLRFIDEFSFVQNSQVHLPGFSSGDVSIPCLRFSFPLDQGFEKTQSPKLMLGGDCSSTVKIFFTFKLNLESLS